MTLVLIISAVFFAIGVYGALTRRSAIAILVSLEIMMNAGNVNFVGFSRLYHPELMTGQVFALIGIVAGASEAAVGLALILALYRRYRTTDLKDVNLLKG